MLLQCRKVVPHNCSPTSESCSPKHRCKAVAPKRLCFKPAKAILQSDSRKLLPKVASQTCGASKLPYKAAPSCSLKLLPKAVPLRCSTKLCPKLFSKAVAPKLRKAAPKVVAARSCQRSGKLSKVAPQSCYPKLFPVAPQSCSPKLLPESCDSANLFTKTAPKAILQSGSQKLLPKVATESCSRCCL